MSRRSDRVAEQIQRYAAQALAELNLSREVLLTVTRARVSPDMKQATVWVAGWRQLTPGQQERATHEVARLLARNLTSKFTPRVTIEADDAGEYASKIAHLLSG
ncbi:ribosome-binding factor A [bacterium]|nr:ribosome-binding factor A [bacterium]